MRIFHGKLKKSIKKVADEMKSSATDPNGSYTGIVTDEGYSVPEQDVDDL